MARWDNWTGKPSTGLKGSIMSDDYQFKAYTTSKYDEKEDDAFWEELARQLNCTFGPKHFTHSFGMTIVRRKIIR